MFNFTGVKKLEYIFTNCITVEGSVMKCSENDAAIWEKSQSCMNISPNEAIEFVRERGIRVFRDYLTSNTRQRSAPIGRKGFTGLYNIVFNIYCRNFQLGVDLVVDLFSVEIKLFVQEEYPSFSSDASNRLILSDIARYWEKFVLMNKWMTKLLSSSNSVSVSGSSLLAISVSELHNQLICNRQSVLNSFFDVMKDNRLKEWNFWFDNCLSLSLDEDSRILKSVIMLLMFSLDKISSLRVASLSSIPDFSDEVLVEFTTTIERSYLIDVEAFCDNQFCNWKVNVPWMTLNEDKSIVTLFLTLLAMESRRCQEFFPLRSKNEVNIIFARCFELQLNNSVEDYDFDEYLLRCFDIEKTDINVRGFGDDSLKKKMSELMTIYHFLDVHGSGQSSYLKDFSTKFSNLIKINFAKLLNRQSNINIRDASALLGFYQEVAMFVESCHIFVDDWCQSEPMLREVVEGALREVLNQDCFGKRSVELFARFCNMYLIKGMESCSNFMIIGEQVLPYLNDKDIFLEMNRSYLFLRIANGKLSNLDLERAFVGFLKNSCGGHKMERLLLGYMDSLQYEQRYSKWLEDGSAENVSLSEVSNNSSRSSVDVDIDVDVDVGVGISIASDSTGPIESRSDPPSMRFCPLKPIVLDSPLVTGQPEFNFSIRFLAPISSTARCFERYYEFHFPSRRISMLYTVGTMDLGYFPVPSKKYFISTGVLQALILLLFNPTNNSNVSPVLSLLQIAQYSGIPSNGGLKKLMHSLVQSKLLYHVPSTSLSNQETVGFSNECTFGLNVNLQVKKTKIIVSPVVLEEDNRQLASIASVRKVLLEAAVVRIMKARRRIRHADLVVEVAAQLRNSGQFVVEAKDLKACLEDLIGREYLRRTDMSMDEYEYLP